MVDHHVGPKLTDAAGYEIGIPVEFVQCTESADPSRFGGRKSLQVELHAAHKRTDSALNGPAVALGHIVEQNEETGEGL